MEKITVEKHIHPGWSEWRRAKRAGYKGASVLGKYQYIYSNGWKKLSLIKIRSFLYYGMKRNQMAWEIYDGSDCVQFKTKKEAVERIHEILK